MDYGKFPLHLDAPALPAASEARFLDTIATPFLRSTLGDGSEALKKADRLYTRAAPLEDGYYSLGLVDGVYRIVASPTGRGTFVSRGEAGGESFNVPAVAFYGKGKGLVLGPDQPQGTLNNFDGKPNAFNKVQLYLTTNGKTLKPHYAVTYGTPNGNPGSVSFGAGAWVTDGEGARFMAHASYMAMQAGQQFPVFQMDWGDTQEIAPTLSLTNQLNSAATVLRLGPDRLLMFHRVYRPHYDPSSIDSADNPGIFLSRSDDGGRTWSLVLSMGPMWDDFGSVYANLPFGGGDNVTYGPRFNAAVFDITVNVYPVTRDRSVVIASVPRVETLGGPVLWKVKLGWLDAATGAMTAVHTLYDGADAGDANAFFNASGVVLPDGVRIFCRPVSPTAWNEPRRVLRTVDGTTYEWLGYMPQPNYKTGLVTAVDRKTLICPMYDGKFSLYQSTDGGVEWKRRATIFAGGTPPDPADEDLNLRNFAQITFLRDAGRPASATPAAPWIHDARINPPV